MHHNAEVCIGASNRLPMSQLTNPPPVVSPVATENGGVFFAQHVGAAFPARRCLQRGTRGLEIRGCQVRFRKAWGNSQFKQTAST